MDPVAHKCKNCNYFFNGNFCNHCGEKVYTKHDKSIAHLVEEGFHFITHFEGTFLTTLKTIVLRPGLLSFEYCNGIRKKYFKPLSFFLLLVVLYLVFPVFKGLNMTLNNHTSNLLYWQYASRKVDELMQAHKWNMETASEHFHVVSEKVSKFLLFIIIPFMALFNKAILSRKRKLYFDHLIFSTEMSSFFILWGFLIVPAAFLLLSKLFWIFGGTPNFHNEDVTDTLILLVFWLYATLSFRRFYTLTTQRALLVALLFVFVFALFIFFIYKFLLFFITINLVR